MTSGSEPIKWPKGRKWAIVCDEWVSFASTEETANQLKAEIEKTHHCLSEHRVVRFGDPDG